MAGPKPNDTYSPLATVAPNNPGSDYLNSRATASDFGAQIGSAMADLGQTGQRAASTQMEHLTQEQGLANEHAANSAELDLAVQGGLIDEEYKSLVGLDASNSKDSYVQKYMELNGKIRDSLPTESARRSYDAVANRRVAFTIQNMNSYAATQKKAAYRDGNTASIKLSQDRASNPDVAMNPTQFGTELGNLRFNLASIYTAPEYGKYQTVGVQMGKDGLLVFEDSDQGRMAQADYDNALIEAEGKIYQNAASAIQYNEQGGVVKAKEFVEQNKDRMPSAVYASLQKSLAAPYRTFQTRQIADTEYATAKAEYAKGSADATFADYVSRNWATLMKNAEDKSLQMYPGDVVLANQARTHAEQRFGDVIKEQNLANNANQHMFMNYITKGNIGNISQLESGPPEVVKAWHDYAAANPRAYDNVNRILTAKNFPRQAGYGTNFYNNLLKTLNGEYSDTVQMGSEIQSDKGSDSPLTLNGQSALGNILKSRGTPQGQQFWDEAKGYFEKLQSNYTGYPRVQGTTPYTTNAEFNKALREVMPRIESGLAKGLTASQMFSPTINGRPNPDFIEPTVNRPTPAAQRRSTMPIFNNPVVKYDTKEKIVAGYNGGKGPLPKEEAEKLLRALGYKSKSEQTAASSVPLPTD